MMPGVPERRMHSYVRHGMTSPFAALDVASGFVIGKCHKRRRAVEFLKLLREIDAQVPEGLDVHIVMDNYATHKTLKIKAWLARRPHYHFTPTSASWINQVERWFAELTREQIQRGVHTSLRQLGPTSVPSSTCTHKTEALQMEQVRRPDFGFLQTLLPQSSTDFMWRTLDSRHWQYFGRFIHAVAFRRFVVCSTAIAEVVVER
jgi:transposase